METKQEPRYMTVREAYSRALVAAEKNPNVPVSQRHMVACLAVNAEMPRTTENLVALSMLIKEAKTTKEA